MKKAIMGLAAFFFSFTLFAQVKFSSLAEVLAYADKHSLDAKTAQLEEQAIAKDEQLFRSTLMPRIELVAAADYNIIIPSMVVPDRLLGGTEGKYSKVQFGLPFSLTPAVELSIPLINPEKWAEEKKYALEKERARHNTSTRMEQLHIQLAQAYYNALAAKELLALSDESKANVAQLLAVLDQRKKEGILQPVDYNRAKLLQADIENNAVSWQLLLSTSITTLHQLMNIPAADSIALSEKPALNWKLADVTQPSHRPALLAAKATSKIAEQALLQSKKASLPKVSLRARYAYQWQVINEQAVHFDMSTVGLQVGVPLFAGGFYKTAQKKAALLTEATKVNEQRSLASLRKEHADWMNHYTSAANKQKHLQQKVAATAGNLRIAQLSTKEGVMEFDEYHTIFQEWLRARMEHLQVLNEGLLYQFLLTQK